MERYGALRIVSMVLHVDEKTPHIHLVILALAVTVDGRRSDQTPRWALVGRTISGPGMYDQVQDDYAAAMAHFGLVRGVKNSGRKHELVTVYLARMAAKEQELDDLRDAAANAKIDHDAKVAADEKRIDAEWAEIRRQLMEIAATRTAADDVMARAQLKAQKVSAHSDRLLPLFKAATEFRKRLDAVGDQPLTPAASAAYAALGPLQTIGSMVTAPQHVTRPTVLATYANIRHQAAAIGR